MRPPDGCYWFRLTDTGGRETMEVSVDGETWLLLEEARQLLDARAAAMRAAAQPFGEPPPPPYVIDALMAENAGQLTIRHLQLSLLSETPDAHV